VKPVVQLEPTGCGIASAAALAGLSYGEAKRIAGSLGIRAEDETLWSSTSHVRKLLRRLGIRARAGETPFRSWRALPDLALLSVKWHLERGRPYWHWVVFVRDSEGAYVLDPKKALRTHRRTDFGRMRPKWFIRVVARAARLRKSSPVAPTA